MTSTLPGLIVCGQRSEGQSGVRGKSKDSATIKGSVDSATIKGSVSAVYMETCDREQSNASLPYLDLGHSSPLTDNSGL